MYILFCFIVLILDYENSKNFTLRASSGIVSQRHDSKYELSTFQVLSLSNSHFQELSMLVHVSTGYEEVFVRRNAVLMFLQRYFTIFLSFYLQYSSISSNSSCFLETCLSWQYYCLHMRVSFFLFLFHLIEKQIIQNIVLYMIFMMMRKNVHFAFFPYFQFYIHYQNLVIV